MHLVAAGSLQVDGRAAIPIAVSCATSFEGAGIQLVRKAFLQAAA